MSATPKPIRVMLVDDQQIMIWGIQKLIHDEGSKMEVVATATSGEEALNRVDAVLPDVILADLSLNGHFALELLPKLLANGVSRTLLFTAVSDTTLLDLAVLGGARGVLSKRSSVDLILKAIEKVHFGELWLDSEMLARAFHQMMTPMTLRPHDVHAQKLSTLTAKERKIIEAITTGGGAPYKVLADQLFISLHTFQNHLTSIFQKLGVANRLELYVYATKHHTSGKQE